jgi:hypothetical protein
MAKTSGGDLPDGTSEIFFAEGLDMNSNDLPVGQIIGGLRGASQAKTAAADPASLPTVTSHRMSGAIGGSDAATLP